MDLCFGNAAYNASYLTNGWRWRRATPDHYRYYKRLFEDPDFLQRYIDRWSELRTNVLATSNVLALIDGYAAELQYAQKRNYERWPTLGKKTRPSWFVGQTYEDEVNWLKEWVKGRLDWIDSEDFPKPAMVVDEPQRRGGAEASEQSTINPNIPSTIRMACLVGKIHYTTDGTDPRLSGGAVSPSAAQYKDPIPVTPGLRLFARVRSDYGLWSAPVIHSEPPQAVAKEAK